MTKTNPVSEIANSGHHTNKLGYKPIFPLLISMAFPAILSMMIQALYNLVDSYFVGKISESALQALSIIFPIQILMISFSVGTSIGVSSYISRSLGRKDQKEAESAAAHGIVLSLITYSIFALIGLFGAKAFMSFFTGNQEIRLMGIDYLQIIAPFSFGLFIEISIEKTLQATGNMIVPMLLQSTGAILNCIFDPILIFGYFGFPALGIKGAAIATVGAQIIAGILSVLYILLKKHAIHITLLGFTFKKETIINIYKVGAPSMIMSSVGSFLVMGLNQILIQFSELSIAVLGVYFKLQSFIFMPIFGLSQGMMPIIGYNYGARQFERVHRTFRYSLLLSLTYMTLGMIAFWMIPSTLLDIFSASTEMKAIGIPALRIISISFIPASIVIVGVSMFQALGEGRRSMGISLSRQLLFLLPIAYIGSKIRGIYLVWAAFPISETLALLITLYFWISFRHKLDPKPFI